MYMQPRKPTLAPLVKVISIKPVLSFLRHLAFKYQTKAEDACQEHEKLDAFAKASRLLESAYDDISKNEKFYLDSFNLLVELDFWWKDTKKNEIHCIKKISK